VHKIRIHWSEKLRASHFLIT